jgi:hypothetical protein
LCTGASQWVGLLFASKRKAGFDYPRPNVSSDSFFCYFFEFGSFFRVWSAVRVHTVSLAYIKYGGVISTRGTGARRVFIQFMSLHSPRRNSPTPTLTSRKGPQVGIVSCLSCAFGYTWYESQQPTKLLKEMGPCVWRTPALRDYCHSMQARSWRSTFRAPM